jgi:exonuclease 3'-5' domain-containing protein 1
VKTLVPGSPTQEDEELSSIVLKSFSSLTIEQPKISPSQKVPEGITSSHIGTVEEVSDLIDSITGLTNNPPSLYLDLEGVNLSRHGTISILQIFVLPTKHAYLVDVCVLGSQAFTTAGKNKKTLKAILESPDVQKAIFDVRNDSDALYSHFGIRLDGIQDIQLMELACRPFRKKFVNGLAKCIEYDAMLTGKERRIWKETKDEGVRLFAPERGGSYEVFNTRPLSDPIKSYCIQDVQYLPRLWSVYKSRISPVWLVKVQVATKERIKLSQSSFYEPHGKHKALGPW